MTKMIPTPVSHTASWVYRRWSIVGTGGLVVDRVAGPGVEVGGPAAILIASFFGLIVLSLLGSAYRDRDDRRKAMTASRRERRKRLGLHWRCPCSAYGDPYGPWVHLDKRRVRSRLHWWQRGGS